MDAYACGRGSEAFRIPRKFSEHAAKTAQTHMVKEAVMSGNVPTQFVSQQQQAPQSQYVPPPPPQYIPPPPQVQPAPPTPPKPVVEAIADPVPQAIFEQKKSVSPMKSLFGG